MVLTTLDKEALEDMDAILDEERADVSTALRGYGPGSAFQNALEAFATSMNDGDESEESISREIALETQRLEELELKVRQGLQNEVTNTADPPCKDSNGQWGN